MDIANYNDNSTIGKLPPWQNQEAALNPPLNENFRENRW
jgi:hypothetical protein